LREIARRRKERKERWLAEQAAKEHKCRVEAEWMFQEWEDEVDLVEREEERDENMRRENQRKDRRQQERMQKDKQNIIIEQMMEDTVRLRQSNLAACHDDIGAV
jgi:hypothetical protein